jgi:hypothetical protein
MIKSKPADAKALIDLAERMGIPTDDAIRRVVRHMTEPRRSVAEPVVDRGPVAAVDK